MKVEFSKQNVETMEKALKKWGLQVQIGQAIEECAELIVALQKYTNRKPTAQALDDVLNEIADVEMLLAQLRLAFGMDCNDLRQRMDAQFKKLEQYLIEEE